MLSYEEKKDEIVVLTMACKVHEEWVKEYAEDTDSD